MAMLRSDANPAFLPDDIGALITQPVQREAIATTVATVVQTGSATFRIPIVTDDPSANWTAEGEEIATSDASLDEIEVHPDKLAGLTVISRELADDSSPEAANVVGNGLARDIARKLDAAFFGDTISNGPDGLESLTSVNTVDAGTEWTNSDPFVEAVYAAEGVGAQVTSWIANPEDALALSQLKEGTNSERGLLQPDPSQPSRRTIEGVPLFPSPAVTPGHVWGIPRARVHVVMRDNTTLDIDRSSHFTSDRVAIRATMRVGFGFPHEAAIQKITLSTE